METKRKCNKCIPPEPWWVNKIRELKSELAEAKAEIERLQDKLEAARAEGAAAEQERCAGIAEKTCRDNDMPTIGWIVATAIRAGSDEPQCDNEAEWVIDNGLEVTFVCTRHLAAMVNKRTEVIFPAIKPHDLGRCRFVAGGTLISNAGDTE